MHVDGGLMLNLESIGYSPIKIHVINDLRTMFCSLGAMCWDKKLNDC